jgi:hypothetical protein
MGSRGRRQVTANITRSGRSQEGWALWYTNFPSNTIGRVTTSGAASSYPVGIGEPNGITAGPDGACGSRTRATTPYEGSRPQVWSPTTPPRKAIPEILSVQALLMKRLVRHCHLRFRTTRRVGRPKHRRSRRRISLRPELLRPCGTTDRALSSLPDSTSTTRAASVYIEDDQARNSQRLLCQLDTFIHCRGFPRRSAPITATPPGPLTSMVDADQLRARFDSSLVRHRSPWTEEPVMFAHIW